MAELVELIAAGLKNTDGTNLASGLVYCYEPGSATLKNVYSEAAATTPVNPVTLDSTGVATVYGTGSYKFIVRTSALALVRTIDNVLVSSGSGISTTQTYYAASDGQSVIPTPAYTKGGKNLRVYWQGSRQIVDVDYTETGSGTTLTQITLVAAAATLVKAGDRFFFEVI